MLGWGARQRERIGLRGVEKVEEGSEATDKRRARQREEKEFGFSSKGARDEGFAYAQKTIYIKGYW